MIFKKFAGIAAAVLSFFLMACGDISIDHSANGITKSMLASSATIETAATLEVLASKLALKVSGTSATGCTFTGSDSTTTTSTVTAGTIFSALTLAQGQVFTPSVYLNVQKVSLQIRRVGGPSGNMFAQIRSVSGSDPSASVLATTGDVLISTASTGGNGALLDFTLASSYEMAAGTSLSLVLKPQTDATLDGSNNFRWMVSNSTPTEGCTNFFAYRTSSDSGSSWSAGAQSYQRNVFTLTADVHSTPGQASWIVTGPSSSTTIWKMSTFTFSENPGDKTTGTITYDVGAGASSSTPSYSQTGLTLAQVQALSNLTGSYFYCRANLSVSNTFNQALLGDGSIKAQ